MLTTLVSENFGVTILLLTPEILVSSGFFTGKYLSKDATVEAGSRFDDNKVLGKVGILSRNRKLDLSF
jgi:hypothetical protein